MKTKVVAILLLLFVFVATPLKVILDLLNPPMPGFTSCSSRIESRLFGVFAGKLAPTPRHIHISGHSVDLGNAWLEHQSEFKWRLIWLPYRTKTSGYNLVIKPRFEDTRELNALLYVEGMHMAFGMVNGGELLIQELPDGTNSEYTVIVAEDFTSPPIARILFTKQ